MSRTDNNKVMGSMLRAQREAKGLSLQRMATALDITINTLRKHEAGETMFRTDILCSAAKILEIPVNALIVDAVPAKRGKTADAAA